jgi:molybdopterin/thiamine biosynthesis adenylyltransferase
LGVVTGVIGNMQALEAIKIITGLHGMFRDTGSFKRNLAAQIRSPPFFCSLPLDPRLFVASNFVHEKLRVLRVVIQITG